MLSSLPKRRATGLLLCKNGQMPVLGTLPPLSHATALSLTLLTSGDKRCKILQIDLTGKPSSRRSTPTTRTKSMQTLATWITHGIVAFSSTLACSMEETIGSSLPMPHQANRANRVFASSTHSSEPLTSELGRSDPVNLAGDCRNTFNLNS